MQTPFQHGCVFFDNSQEKKVRDDDHNSRKGGRKGGVCNEPWKVNEEMWREEERKRESGSKKRGRERKKEPGSKKRGKRYGKVRRWDLEQD